MHDCHQHKQETDNPVSCCATENSGVKIGIKLKLALIALLLLYILSYLPSLQPIHESFNSYFSIIWWAVLLGLIIGGIIDYFVPDGFIYRFLGRSQSASIPNAVVAGFLLSACSHGILAIAIQLYKKGAGVPSVIAFLLAAPWANLPVTILLFGFFGWQALWILAAAIIIALLTGYIFIWLDKKGFIEKSQSKPGFDTYTWDSISQFDLKKSLRGTWNGSLNLANMVLWWIIIGFIAAVLISAYVPHHIFASYFGPDFIGMLLTLAAATVIEVCSEGSAPLAFEIHNQLNVLGNPFIFLMAGVVTDYTEIGLIWTNIGKRAALMLPVVTVPQVLLVAYLMNQLL